MDYEGLGDFSEDFEGLDELLEDAEGLTDMPDIGDVPRFSASEADAGEFTDEDTDALARVKTALACPECNSGEICDSMFAHLLEAAYARIAVLSSLTSRLIYVRAVMRGMCADTTSDLDVAIRSAVEETTRIARLAPKLEAAQRGMDSTQ